LLTFRFTGQKAPSTDFVKLSGKCQYFMFMVVVEFSWRFCSFCY